VVADGYGGVTNCGPSFGEVDLNFLPIDSVSSLIIFSVAVLILFPPSDILRRTASFEARWRSG